MEWSTWEHWDSACFSGIRQDKLIYGCIGGLLTSLFYCICSDLGMSILILQSCPSYCLTLYAEIIARIVKGSIRQYFDTGGNSPDAWRDFILYNERYCRWRYGKGTGTGWNHASGGTKALPWNYVYFRYFLSVDQLEQTAKRLRRTNPGNRGERHGNSYENVCIQYERDLMNFPSLNNIAAKESDWNGRILRKHPVWIIWKGKGYDVVNIVTTVINRND